LLTTRQLVHSSEGAFEVTSSTKSEWLIPAGLIALSFFPVLAGTFRLIQLGGGAEITPDNARFFATPFPFVLHVITVTIYCILGAFQFVPGFRSRRPDWHRIAGRVVVPCGLIAALTGLWMAHYYPRPHYDGTLLYAIRLLVGSAMVLFIYLGMAAIWRGDILGHRPWMMRGYALGLGAGTQVLTHLPWFLFPRIRGEPTRALFMGAGWVINLAVVEWILMRERTKVLHLTLASAQQPGTSNTGGTP
jgi:uncharacterized membrane protein